MDHVPAGSFRIAQRIVNWALPASRFLDQLSVRTSRFWSHYRPAGLVGSSIQVWNSRLTLNQHRDRRPDNRIGHEY
jgi:hypothetical protein